MHTPVLLEEVLEYLDPQPGKQYIDATLNGGGHTRALVQRIAPTGRVVGIEWDPEIAALAKKEFAGSSLVTVVNDTYVHLARVAREQALEPDGILFDFGLSSWHYESSGRGFSFKRDEPLDMRFHPTEGISVREIVNTYEIVEIEQILRDYGDERFSNQIAEAIARARRMQPIITTSQLVAVIESAVPNWYRHQKIHCATKTFQALRVVANDELGNVKRGIEAALEVIKPGGRIVAISFQGHEDKIVRELFKTYKHEGLITLPAHGTIRPRWGEQTDNPRSRSAKMKVAEKIQLTSYSMPGRNAPHARQ